MTGDDEVRLLGREGHARSVGRLDQERRPIRRSWDEAKDFWERTVVMLDFDRITTDPEMMGGAPCIRGLRIPVATVVDMVAEGMTAAEIAAALPDLEAADVEQALRYAAESVRQREHPFCAAS